jgi:hypothetical protein
MEEVVDSCLCTWNVPPDFISPCRNALERGSELLATDNDRPNINLRLICTAAKPPIESRICLSAAAASDDILLD